MKASYFGCMGYSERHKFPADWPVPPSFQDPKISMRSYQEGIEECEFAEEMGFDWVSLSEHHYSGNRTTPNPAVMAAAVADYQPVEPVGQKIKLRQKGLSLSMVRTPDILAEIGRRAGLVKVGFAAESEDLLTNARRKLDEKRLDLIVANNVTAQGSGFGSDTNRVTLLDGEGEEELPLMSKYEVAGRILDRVAAALRTEP